MEPYLQETKVWVHTFTAPETVLSLQEDVASTLVYFGSLGDVFYLTGLALLGMGFLAWATNKKNTQRYQWGKRMFGVGIAFTLIGFNTGAFLSLLYYIVGG